MVEDEELQNPTNTKSRNFFIGPVIFVLLTIVFEVFLMVYRCPPSFIVLDCKATDRLLYYSVSIPSIIVFLLFSFFVGLQEKRMSVFDTRIYYLLVPISVIFTISIEAMLLVLFVNIGEIPL